MTITYKDYVGKNYFISEVMAELPGAEEGQITRVLNNVVREFYKETAAWHMTLDCSGVTLPAGATDLDLSSYVHAVTESRFADIYRIPAMWVDNVLIEPTATPDLSQNTNNYVTKIDSGEHFYHQGSGKIRFSHPLSTAYAPTKVVVVFILVPNVLVANVPIRVSPNSTDRELPILAYQEHAEAITSGVLARMMAMPSKPYTNPLMATYHGRKYRNDTIKYRNEAKRFLTFNTNSTSPFPFFA